MLLKYRRGGYSHMGHKPLLTQTVQVYFKTTLLNAHSKLKITLLSQSSLYGINFKLTLIRVK